MSKVVIWTKSLDTGGSGFRVTRPLVLDIDATQLAVGVGEAVAEEAREAIENGLHGQVKGRQRGKDSGHLLRSFRVNIEKTGTTAEVSVNPPHDRVVFLTRELGRGIKYISPERSRGRIKKAIAKWRKSVRKL